MNNLPLEQPESQPQPTVDAKKKALAVNALKLGLVAAAALFGKSELESFSSDIEEMKVKAERVLIEQQNEPTNYSYNWHQTQPPVVDNRSNLPEYHDGREFRPLKGLLDALFR